MKGREKLARRAGAFILSAFVFCFPAVVAETAGGAQTSGKQPGTSTPKPSRIQEELRGDNLAEQKQFADAIRVYHQLLRDYPRDATLMLKIGNAFLEELNTLEARRYYERAAHADPKDARAFNNLGALEYHRKNYKKAVQHYNKAIAIDPQVGSFYSNLGYAWLGQKRFEAAIAAFRKAIQIDPSVFEKHGQSGTVLMERSVEDRGQFFFYLAKSFAESGDAARCADYLRKSRDEGYKLVSAAKTDPAFASVREDPLVKDILDSLTPEAKSPSSL
jgi:Tfp pilus assembly protein PilF